MDFGKNLDRVMQASARFEKIMGELGFSPTKSRAALMMDLQVADGVNGNPPLDWDRLLAADDLNFLHDVGGIRRHVNRQTGKLEDHFTPRFAKV